MKKTTKNKILAAVTSVAAIGTALAIIIPMLTPGVSAITRLYGIQQLVDKMEDETFNIIEIVPDHAYSSLGFLAKGSEPNVDGKFFVSNDTYEGRKNAIVGYLGNVSEYLENGISGVNYSERLYTYDGDVFSLATFPEGHSEVRKGYFRVAEGNEKGSFAYIPQVSLRQYLYSVERNGIALPTEGYIPAAGDKITLGVDIASSGALSSHNFKIEAENASGSFELSDGENGISISDGSFSLNSPEKSAWVLLTYTVDSADAGRTVSVCVSADGGLYSSDKATVKIPNNSDVVSATIKAAARYNGTVTTGLVIEDSWQNGSIWMYNFKVVVSNGGSEDIHSWNLVLNDMVNLGIDVKSSWNINWYTADGNLYVSDDGNGCGNVPHNFENYETTAGFQASFDSRLTDDVIASLKGSSEYYLIDASVEFGSAQTEIPFSVSVNGGDSVSKTETSASLCSVTAEECVSGEYDFVCDISAIGNRYYIEIPFGDTAAKTIQTSVVKAGGNYSEAETETIVYNSDYVPSDDGQFVWIDDETCEEFTLAFTKLYYDVTSECNNYFARNILQIDDADTDRINKIKIYSFTPTEFEKKLVDNELSIANVGLIYVSNSSAFDLPDDIVYGVYDGENDISWQTCYNILDNVVNVGMPVIIDRYILRDSSSAGISAAKAEMTEGNNIVRLCYLLRYYLFARDSAIEITDETVDWDDSLATVLASNTLGSHSVSYGDYGAVGMSVFINSRNTNVIKCGFGDTIGVWNTVNVTSTNLYGFNEVGSEIESDAFFSNSGSAGSQKVDEYNGENESVTIWYKTIIKYILNYSQRRLLIYKDTIRILDIEPTKFSTLTSDMVKTWLGGDNSTQRKYEIVQMSTYEFVGKIESLLENYDMVYVGSCIGRSGERGSLNQSNGVTSYNDTSMNGLIYTHVGDKVTIKYDSNMGLRHKGLLTKDYDPLNTSNMDTRFSGNDLTEEKANELIEYALAGYPVVISDGMISSDSKIRTDRVDRTSYMYKFLSTVFEVKSGSTYTYVSRDIDGRKITQTVSLSALKNVVKQQSKAIPGLIKYVNMPRLSIALVDRPLDYSVTEDNNDNITDVKYMQKTGNKYVLSYTFEISNSSETNPRDTFYRVRLYTDVNADGKYSETEELDGLTVMDASTYDEVDYDKLQTGHLYIASRELPDDYVGMTPWKLVVELNDTSLFAPKTSVIGYTAIKAESTVTIKVLQIMGSGKPDGGCLNLSSDGTFTKLFNNVRTKMGYDVQIKTITAEGIVSEYNKTANRVRTYSDSQDFYNKYLDLYDMLILGFQDCFDDIDSDEVSEAIAMFINSGKSVLFSHDTTSAFNATKNEINSIRVDTGTWYHFWGYHMNTFVRPLVGMDRYGITNDSMKSLLKGLSADVGSGNVFDSIVSTASDKHLDVAYKNDGKISYLTHGFNNYDLLMYRASGNNFLNYGTVGNYQEAERVTTISQVNEGQITNYPYDINIGSITGRGTPSNGYYSESVQKTLSVATTHAQYYQLNLATDNDNDGIGDLVVWYCLAGGNSNGHIYDSLPNDVTNGYYIYSSGNILYTGMGHSGGKVNTDEAKLFVNTIIAAYHSGLKAPKVTIVKSEETKNVTLKYIYRTFDGVSNVEDKDETFAFSVKDNNIVNATRDIHYNIYKEVKSTDSYTTQIQMNGATVYLKNFTNIELAEAFGEDFRIGTIGNGQFVNMTVKSDWINAQMMAVMNESEDAESDGTFRIFIGAQTELTYKNYDGTTGVVKYTDNSYECLTFKSRSLFPMD